MDLKKINTKELPKEVKEVYNELKELTDNFDKDVMELFESEVSDFKEILQDYPKAVEPKEPKETKTTITGKPTNLSQLKKWLKQNIGKKIYTKDGERKITKVQTQAFLTVDAEGKEHPYGFPKAASTSYSKIGFKLGKTDFVFNKADLPAAAPERRTTVSRSARQTIQRIKNSPKYKSQTKGRSDSDIIRDAGRPAKKPGWKIAKSGRRYYENRPNRTDISPKTYPKLEKGGEIESGDRVIITTDSLGKEYKGMTGIITSRKFPKGKHGVKLANGMELVFEEGEFKHDHVTNPKYAGGGEIKNKYLVTLSSKNGVVGKRFSVNAKDTDEAKKKATSEIKKRYGYYPQIGYTEVRIEPYNFAKGGKTPVHNQKLDMKYQSKEDWERNYKRRRRAKQHPRQMAKGGIAPKIADKTVKYANVAADGDYGNVHFTDGSYLLFHTHLETNRHGDRVPKVSATFHGETEGYNILKNGQRYAGGGKTTEERHEWGLEINRVIHFEDADGFADKYEQTEFLTGFKSEKAAIEKADEIEKNDDRVSQIDVYAYTYAKGGSTYAKGGELHENFFYGHEVENIEIDEDEKTATVMFTNGDMLTFIAYPDGREAVIKGNFIQNKGGKQHRLKAGDIYAKGGITEHGLQLGDEIIGYGGKNNEILNVKHRRGQNRVNLQTGERTTFGFGEGGKTGSKNLSASSKFDYVMREFDKGILQSGSGKKVTDKSQALAIAYSEARKIDKNFK
jgi:hypothetical protein